MDTSRRPSFAPNASTEVRRAEDGELCGYVVERPDGWSAVTVFGGHLGDHETAEGAERQVRDGGLASLAERWVLVDALAGEEQIVCIQEATPNRLRLALDYYSLPGVPTLDIGPDDLAGGRWQLRRN
jgi:hypothetical protein